MQSFIITGQLIIFLLMVQPPVLSQTTNRFDNYGRKDGSWLNQLTGYYSTGGKREEKKLSVDYVISTFTDLNTIK